MRPLNAAFTRLSLPAAVFVIALAALAALAAPAAAAPQRGHFGGAHVVVRGGLYAPFWGSFSPYWAYPYAGYPYAGYPYWAYPYDVYPLPPTAEVKTDVTPKQTEVYVDGY